jgi:hypothetical protein
MALLPSVSQEVTAFSVCYMQSFEDAYQAFTRNLGENTRSFRFGYGDPNSQENVLYTNQCYLVLGEIAHRCMPEHAAT